MMATDLPALLDALGELFLVPGAWPEATFRNLQRETWLPGDLREAVTTLVGTAHSDLAVQYAGLFLHARNRPTLRLEASAQRAGSLQAPEVLAELEAMEAATAWAPVAGRQPDHLGVLLSLLAHHLRLLAAPEAGQEARLEQDAGTLLGGYLQPMARHLAEGLALPGTPPFYAAAGGTLVAALGLCGRILTPLAV
jgi:TorA maturation chaperone TorD